jgi:endo-1,4-beta-xylanase
MKNGSMILLWFCSMMSAVVWAQNPLGLRASSALRGILFGTAASINSLRKDVDGGQYNSYIKKNYQVIEPENDFKPMKLWRGPNNYSWTDSDWLLGATANSTGWAQQNGMQIRGHTLVWANDKRTPDWLLKQESSISSDKAKSLLSDYIHAVVGRYRGKIPWWDVVNEAVDDVKNNSRSFNLRDCFWYRKLGQDFVKYAFIYAQQADPQAQLYYNDYNNEDMGTKANTILELLKWVRSQGGTIHGVGMQWHIRVSRTISHGDQHYQNAERLISNGFDFMVTELDIAIPMNGESPRNPNDIKKQGLLYRALLKYVLHFSPKCRALITWGFTDRYSWVPAFYNYTEGAALPSDWNYQPKSAYWQMQEELARVLPDGTYRLSPQSQPNKCLGIYNNGKTVSVQLYSDGCSDANRKWNIIWLDDGTYRLSSQNISARALTAFNTTAAVGEIQIKDWSSNVNQEWVLSSYGKNVFRIRPRTAWWRALTVYGTSNVGIIDFISGDDKRWILSSV